MVTLNAVALIVAVCLLVAWFVRRADWMRTGYRWAFGVWTVTFVLALAACDVTVEVKPTSTTTTTTECQQGSFDVCRARAYSGD